MKSYKLLLLPGDGIGPEVMGEVARVVAWVNASGLAAIETETDLVGGCAYDAHGQAISESAMERALAADAVMLGAVGGPKWDGVAYDQRPEAGLPALSHSPPPHLLFPSCRRFLAEARPGRRPRHHDRARADRRGLFRPAEGDRRAAG